MDVVKQARRLIFDPLPRKVNQQEWESILNFGSSTNKSELYVLLGDIDNEELLYSCFANLTKGHWDDYLNYDDFEYYVFAWRFDGVLYVSDNPFFEILMRTLRKLCIAFNQLDNQRNGTTFTATTNTNTINNSDISNTTISIDDSVDSSSNSDVLTPRQLERWKEILNVSLKQLNVTSSIRRVETFVKSGLNTCYDFGNGQGHPLDEPKWLSVVFFSALFGLVCLENEKHRLLQLVKDTVFYMSANIDRQSNISESAVVARKYIQFDKLYRSIVSFIQRQCMCPSNPLLVRQSYRVYMRYLTAANDGLLHLMKQIMAVVCSADVPLSISNGQPGAPKCFSTDDIHRLKQLQPSILRAMKNCTNDVLSKHIEDHFMAGPNLAHLHDKDTDKTATIICKLFNSAEIKEKPPNTSLLGHIESVVSLTSYQSILQHTSDVHPLKMKRGLTGHMPLREPINVVIEESVARNIRRNFSSATPQAYKGIAKWCCPIL